MSVVRNVVVLVFLFAAGCASYPTAMQPIQPSAHLLDEKVLTLINNAVYEVIVQKPEKDSLSYEKTLPLDLIPYSVRTDKYYSVGTAFAIGPNQFVSASHVMYLDIDSQFKEVYLRDNEGKVYSIDKILKYSDHKDFAIFSLKNKNAEHFFQVNTSPRVNDKVYAVGNAMGQGVVIRDGLYTSSTPEEEAGEWKWIRFSAAASPGNSGGPLLDKDGKGIGIVLGKSENENLNYALSLSEVMNAKPNKAAIHKKLKYFIDNMDMTKIDTLERETALPKSYHDLRQEIVKSVNQTAEKLLKDLFTENKENIFPRGKGSTLLLNSTVDAVFPNLIMKADDGNWDAFYPKETQKAALDSNGYITYGGLGNSLFLYIRKPDKISHEQLRNDSKLFMDLILKGLYLYREIGTEKIKITSFGKAQEENTLTDAYGRKWLIRTWLKEYDDEKIVTFSLPVPSGYITMMREGQTGLVDNGFIPDMKALADFIYVSYYGTFKHWQDFLQMKSLLPDSFSTINLSIDYNKRFNFTSKKLAFNYAPDVMKISEKSALQLSFTYFDDHGKVVWDIGNIWVGEDKSTGNGFAVARNIKPPKTMDDKYQSKWENIAKQNFPYNASAYYDDNATSLSTVYINKQPEKGEGKMGDILYTVSYWKDGKAEQDEMKAKIDQFIQNLTIHESGRGK